MSKWKAGDYMGSGKSKAQYLGQQQASKSSGGGGVSDSSSQYAALMKKYEKSLKPSKAETKATKGLSELTQSAALGVAKQGQEVMPMDLITGAQRSITEQASLKAAPYKDIIAAEQAKRGAASDVLSAESGLLEKQMAAEEAASTKAQDYQNQLSLIAARRSGGGTSGGKLTSVSKKVGRNTIYGTFNPTTGEYKWNE